MRISTGSCPAAASNRVVCARLQGRAGGAEEGGVAAGKLRGLQGGCGTAASRWRAAQQQGVTRTHLRGCFIAARATRIHLASTWCSRPRPTSVAYASAKPTANCGGEGEGEKAELDTGMVSQAGRSAAQSTHSRTASTAGEASNWLVAGRPVLTAPALATRTLCRRPRPTPRSPLPWPSPG